MRRLTSAGIVASLALPAGSAGSAGARPALIAPQAAGKAHGAPGRLSPDGKLKEFKLSLEGPDGIVSLPNGTLAYVTYSDSSVGVIANGKISETEIQNGGRNPNALTVGPGGQLFVTEYTANKIGRVAVG